MLGAPLAWRLTAGLLALIALALALPPHRNAARGSTGRWAVLAGAVLAMIVALTAEGPTAFWRHVPIGAGRVAEVEGANGYQAYRREVQWATRAEVDGIESSISLQQISDAALMVAPTETTGKVNSPPFRPPSGCRAVT